MAQLQHLSRHLATVSLHLNRVFIELFIEMNNCLCFCMHCVMMFCNKAGARPCLYMQMEGPVAVQLQNKMETMPCLGHCGLLFLTCSVEVLNRNGLVLIILCETDRCGCDS